MDVLILQSKAPSYEKEAPPRLVKLAQLPASMAQDRDTFSLDCGDVEQPLASAGSTHIVVLASVTGQNLLAGALTEVCPCAA
jgi:hypothetical protein